MLGSILDSVALRTARAALGGLSRRTEAIAENVANIDTPGYRRRSVEFEGALEASLQRASQRHGMVTTDSRHISSAPGGAGAPNRAIEGDLITERNDANNVSIDKEMALLAETQIRYQALTTTLTRRLSTLRAVIRG